MEKSASRAVDQCRGTGSKTRARDTHRPAHEVGSRTVFVKTDIHTHAFSKAIAPRAHEALGRVFERPLEGSALLSDLEAEESRAGMERFCVLNCAQRPELVRAVNAWAVSLKSRPGLVPFGTVHPEGGTFEADLDFLERAGIFGIKLHPVWQGFPLGERRHDALWEAVGSRFCVLVHMGAKERSDRALAHPQALVRLAGEFPNVQFMGAHLGGWGMWDEALEIVRRYRGDNLWLDTSNVSAHLDEARLKALFRMLPFERLLFGSDWPFFSVAGEMERLRTKAGLGCGQMDDLLGHADSLLGRFAAFKEDRV